mmetsp:Transcript_9765/g.30356  ORF Transcript_9765/g.30356 Transcript_9765/m.30356 type:complete len:186 (+) Transcript_9765:128-685(+)
MALRRNSCFAALIACATAFRPTHRCAPRRSLGGRSLSFRAPSGVDGRGSSRWRVARPAENDDAAGEDEDTEQLERRLAPMEETLAAFAVGSVAAAGLGVEILDAGAISSALLAGAALGFAAENENQYGFGMFARGVGKIGYGAFKAATAPPPEPPLEDTIAPENFDERIDAVRRELEKDKRELET